MSSLRRRLLIAGGFALAVPVVPALWRSISLARASVQSKDEFDYPVRHTQAQWRDQLTVQQFEVLRREATETPGSSPLLAEKRKGSFHCAGCGQAVFQSETKYDSHTGWPSFWAPIEGAVGTRKDRSLLLLVRTEVHCARCGGHLGHIFDDGPPPTGLRYCINGAALTFSPA